MTIEPLGDRGLIVRDLPMPAWRWAEHLNLQHVTGLIEAYASYDTVGLEIDPAKFKWESIDNIDFEPLDQLDAPARVIPVWYVGEDLEAVASQLQMTRQEVVRIHAEATYLCEAVGFCPGFPYLSGLDVRLQGIPRRASPRTRIEPGSVAITGAQCGIYPLVRPGGWAILGRTPLVLVDVEEQYFPIQAGDRIRFSPIQRSEFETLKGERL